MKKSRAKYQRIQIKSQSKSRVLIVHNSEEREASRRDVVNKESWPTITKPLPECSDNDLHWLVVYFAIINVQFNILLFQLKDVTKHCPWWKPRSWSRCIQKIKDGSKMTNYCSEFCQEPPESSGRWECPDIRRSVLVNSKYQQTSADPCHVLPQQPTQPDSSVLHWQRLQPHPWLQAAPVQSPPRMIPRRRIEGWLCRDM